MKAGIQKYKEAIKKQKAPEPPSKNKIKKEAKSTEKAEKNEKPKKEIKVTSKGEDKPILKSESQKGGITRKQIIESDLPEAVESAVEKMVASETGVEEEEELQNDLEKELEAEADQATKLVKDEVTPTNSTRDQLILEYATLIRYIAQKIACRLPANIELDDLMSSGVIGLMDAIDKYDATRDNKFKTYAEFRIRGAILDELRAQDWVPRSVREKAKMLERAYQKIEQEKGRQASDDEVCAELKMSSEEFHELLGQVRSVSLLSYDDLSSFSKSDKRYLHGYGEAGSKTASPYSEVNLASVKKVIADAIGELPEKQRLVLSLYYYEDLNLKEIGKVLDVTESRVSQLHTQAVIRLKSKLKGHWEEFLALASQ